MENKEKNKNRRPKVPRKIADDILFRSDRKCCICRRQGIRPQIHHIDGNSSNNDPDNLIPLCPNCHSEIEQKGGSGRDCTQGVLRKYRDDWFKEVVNYRKKKVKSKSNKDKIDILVALAQHDVRRISYQIEAARFNWEKINSLLQKLFPYGRDFEYDVRSEIIYVTSIVANHTRHCEQKEVIKTLLDVLIESLPIYSIVNPLKRKLSNKNIELILRAVEIIHTVLWDTCRYLRDLEITEEGANSLYYILKYARLNKLKKVKKRAMEVFNECEKICDEERNSHKFLKGKEILEKEKSLALEE